MDIDRLPTRNLSRDDRTISDNGKELRLPFLDDIFTSGMSLIPIYLKTDPIIGRAIGPKLLLRIYCSEVLKLPRSAQRPKKAIQFGSRSSSLNLPAIHSEIQLDPLLCNTQI